MFMRVRSPKPSRPMVAHFFVFSWVSTTAQASSMVRMMGTSLTAFLPLFMAAMTTCA